MIERLRFWLADKLYRNRVGKRGEDTAYRWYDAAIHAYARKVERQT